MPQIIPSCVPVLSNVFIFSCFKESYYLLLLERMVVKQIVPKAAFPHTASHTGKSLEREKLNKLNPEREREREEKIKQKMHHFHFSFLHY